MLDAAVEASPDDPYSYYNIACSYSLKKYIPKAYDYLKKAIEKGYDDSLLNSQ
jgi:hypothetical protein